MKFLFQFFILTLLTLPALAQNKTEKIPQLHKLCDQTNAISKMQPTGILKENQQLDFILVSKEKNMTYVFSGEHLIFAFKSNFGMTFKTGPKIQEGDKKTPEGIYRISTKNINSKYFRSLKISYPNEYDKAFASEKGVPAGDDIMFHGLPNGLDDKNSLFGYILNKFDWTDGCIALTNENMQILFTQIKVNTPVAICPK